MPTISGHRWWKELKNCDALFTLIPLHMIFLAGTYTCPILGPLVPLFCISGDVFSGFQSQSGFYLIRFCGGKCNVHFLRFTSGSTPADLLVAGIAASHFPTCISRGGTWLGFEWAITRTEDERTWTWFICIWLIKRSNIIYTQQLLQRVQHVTSLSI